MRTTVEFPPDLMRAAKARSAERGESLKNLLARAVAAELGGRPDHAHGGRPRVTLPLFGHSEDSSFNPSNADLERAMSDADAERVGGSEPRRPPRHRRSRRK